MPTLAASSASSRRRRLSRTCCSASRCSVMSVCDAHPLDDLAAFVGDRHRAHREGAVHAVVASHAMHRGECRRCVASARRQASSVAATSSGWMASSQPMPGELVAALAGERAPAGLLADRASLGRVRPDDAGGGEQRGLEAMLAGGEPRFGFLALGDVEHAADGARHDAAAIAHQHAVIPDPDVAAVLVTHAIFAGDAVEIAVRAGGARHARRQCQRAIIRMNQVFPPAAHG